MSLETIINEAKNKMVQSVEVLKKEYATMRTSRATPALLSRIMVSQYGQEVPLQIRNRWSFSPGIKLSSATSKKLFKNQTSA